MRGQGTAVALLFVLIAPNAMALGDGAEEAAGSIRWMAPTHGYADHPVHAAVGMYGGQDLMPHATLALTVTFNDVVLFETTFVHEHDGFHTLVITPPDTGVLRFSAAPTPPGASPGASPAEHESPVVAQVPILAGAPHPWSDDMVTRLFPHVNGLDERSVGFLGNQHLGHASFVDVVDDQGRLLMGLAPVSNAWHATHVMAPPGGFGTGRMHAVVTSHPNINHTIFTESFFVDLDFDETRTVRAANPLTTEQRPSCADTDLPLVTDPNSVSDDGLAWQTWTDVRFAFATRDHLDETDPQHHYTHNQPRPARYDFYAMSPTAPVLGGTNAFMDFRPADPFRELTMRFREPGVYGMDIFRSDRVDDGCQLTFTILPGTESDPGQLDHSISVRNDTARVQFLAKRDGEALPHYEFDTRVMKLHSDDAPGRLVWKGKLHGHNGYAMFELGGLELGTYEVRTYPSPQDLGTPPVAAPTDEGFAYRFTVTSIPEANGTVTEVEPRPAAVPGPGALMSLVMLGLLALALRRK